MGFWYYERSEKVKRLKLKRKYLIIAILITSILSIKTIQITVYKINQNKKIARTDADQWKGYTCSSYELRQYLINR